MKILFTSDWQADIENISLCLSAHKEILGYCERYDIRAVVHGGDLKRAYNPLDGRMIKSVTRMVREYKENDISFMMNLGNHDRYGLHTDGENWLDILRDAGATAFDKPGRCGGYLAFLPFRQSVVMMKREAHDLAKMVGDHKPVLVFHTDLKLARYNLKRSSEALFTVDDLYPDKYVYCIGGHIHLQQQVAKNVYYVGSPFSTDWGEANQVKGYLLYDTSTRTLSKLPSTIPGMFDPTWPKFPVDKKNWKGTKVRIHVQCDYAADVFGAVQLAKGEAEKKYHGAEIVAVPELTSKLESKILLKAQDSDEQKIRTYVEQTLDDSLQQHKNKIVKYLTAQLGQLHQTARRTGRIEFINARAKNFLSFETLVVGYQSGLTVVSGINDDRKGKSNGSGKTSYLSPPGVALFGSTFKGQKHDHWMHRWVQKGQKSWVEINFKDAHGRLCRVVRGRKPKCLRVWVQGKELPAGNRPEQAQEAVERLTGFTWDTLANAMFVDQRKTNLMLTGTESERKQFLARLQGLERFEHALLQVKEDLAALQRNVEAFEAKYSVAAARVEEWNSVLRQLQKETPDIKKVQNELDAAVKALEKEKARFIDVRAKAKVKEKAFEDKYKAINAEFITIQGKVGELTGRINSITTKIDKLEALSAECPTCEQSVDQEKKDSVIEALRGMRSKLVDERASMLRRKNDLSLMMPKLRSKINDINEGNEELQSWIADARVNVATLVGKQQEAKNQELRLESAKKSKTRAEDASESALVEYERAENSVPVYTYCVTAFSKKGLPAFLNAQLCPILNRASAYYSQLFSEKELQVVFNVTETGDTDVQVVNAHGGSEIGDQSQGEMRIASLITSFALRHIAPQTNLLVLDEPGEGLDPLAARTFARGLKEVVPRFGSVFVVTHNPAVLAELAGSRHLVIRKKNRVSVVEEQNGL